MVLTVKDLVLTTLEELAETTKSAKKSEQPPSFNEGDADNVVLSNNTLCKLGGEEEEEDPLDSREEEEDSSYSNKEEKHRDEYMADQDLD